MTSRRERHRRHESSAAALLARVRASGEPRRRDRGVYLLPEDHGHCAAGRDLLREPDAPDLGVDFSRPCPHPPTTALVILDLPAMPLCQCHYDAIERSGALEDE